MRRTLTLIIGTTLVLGGLAIRPAPADATTHPNVVIIMTDDQRWDKVTPQYMPYVSSQLMPYSVQAFAPNSLCCPSRTSVLTGNYSHTTGVWDNLGAYGGFGAFDDKHTMAVDFNQAGYRTAMIGKYLNGYEPGQTRYVPPGWDRWFALRTGDYYDYTAASRRTPSSPMRHRHFGHRAEDDYATNVLREQALDFISGGGPFFMYLAWTAPHGPAIPDPNDQHRFDGQTDFNFGKGTSMLEAAYGTDRATGRILAALPADTIVVFMSDNGYLWGEHGLTGKQQPYEEATRIPMAIRGVGGLTEQTLVANVDLRPTLTAAAGVPMLTPADGINVAQRTRDALVLENLSTDYCGVRTAGWMFVRYATGSEELYDLSTDYAEDHNLVQEMPDKAAAMKDLTRTLCDPAPPGYTW